MVNRVVSDHKWALALDLGTGVSRLRAVFKDIPCPPDRMKEFFAERLVNFGAQTADMHVHNTGITVKVHVPHLFRNQRSLQHLTRMLCE